jgi:hypothetical protein
MLDNELSIFSPVLVRRSERTKAARIISLSILLVSAVAALALVIYRAGGSSKSSLMSQRYFDNGDDSNRAPVSFSTLASSGVDLATLPPEMERQALQGSSGTFPPSSQGRAKYDDLIANGPLGTESSSQRKESLDLETLSPQAQLNALSGKGAAHVLSSRNTLSSNGPGQHKAKGGDNDKVKLGGSIGLDGSIHLLRSARQIIAERLARAHGVNPAGGRSALSSSPSQPASARGSSSAAPQRVTNTQSSAEARLAAEEAKLRSSVASLEQRAVDTEVSDDQGLLGSPPASSSSDSA